MEEKNELLMHLYQISNMGVKSTKKLLDLLKNKDNKIKKILEDELKEYEKYLCDSKKKLDKRKIDPKSLGIMAELMSKMEMQWEVIKDNSDSKIADLLIRGFTMGTIETQKKIDNYKDQSDKKEIELAKDILEFQKKEIEKLKPYL